MSDPVFTRQYRQESVTAIVSLSDTNIATTGQIQLTLDIQVPPGFDVVLPKVEDLIASFTVSGGWSEPQQTLPSGKTLRRNVWLLVPGLAGDAVFQPLEIVAGTATIKTEPIAVSVRSILPEGLQTLEIKDIAAPASLLPEQQKKHHRWFIMLGAAIAAGLLGVAIRFGQRIRAFPAILPHQQAFESLEHLPENAVIRIHELNRILRLYIETRFGLPMIGKTTPEILPVLEIHPFTGLTAQLVDFLGRSETVRFSNRVPDGFAEEAERFVREFVESTMQEEACG